MMNHELTLEEIHKATLENLKKIISICDSQNIKYFLAYGSLIGAVRHKGYIPWDDDLDIMMLRPDYDKFISYCIEHSEEIKPFRLTNKETTPNYPYNISRFVNDNYIGIFGERYDNCDFGGTFIDIYPFDAAGNENKIIIRAIGFYKKILIKMSALASQKKFFPAKSKWCGLIKRLLYKPIRNIGCRYFLNKMDSLGKIFNLEKSKYVACMIWNDGIRPIKKENFLEPTILEFEKIKVKCPKFVDEVLRTSYGDYMLLPSEDKRVCTHNYKIFKK